MRRLVRVVAIGLTAAGAIAAPAAAGVSQDYAETALNIIPSGQYGSVPIPPSADAPGARCTTASRRSSTRSPTRDLDHVLQVRGASATGTDGPARSSRSPTPGVTIERDRSTSRTSTGDDLRRRHLGGRLDRRRGPRRCCCSRPATTPASRRSTCPDVSAIGLITGAQSLRAQRADRGRGREADAGARGRRARRARGAARHRHLHLGHQRLPRGQRPRPTRPGPATTSTRSTRSRASSSARAAATRRGAPSSSAACSSGWAARRARSVFNDLRQFKNPEHARPRSTASSPTGKIPKKPKGSVDHRPRQLPGDRRRSRTRARAEAAPSRSTQRVERADGRRRPLEDRRPADGRRSADRLLLPGPHLRDRHARRRPAVARRDLGPVPRLPADRPRRGLRHHADLGERRHHRPVRRDALRRQRHELRVQGQVPDDGDRSTPARSTATRSPS